MQKPIVNRFVASASEISSSDLYMTVKATMFTVPSANLNGVRCTEAFLDEIVANQDKYVGLPLCADMTKLENGLYRNLGHCYNSATGKFSSTMIGSFYRFEKAEIKEGEIALIGFARVLKRNKKVCSAIAELFAAGDLKFSFEITCGEYAKLDDGTIRIDASEKNFIEGMAIVSMPACPDAVALELVAEITGIGKEAEPMDKDEMKVAEETTETAEENVTEEHVEAEKYVTQTHVEHDRVSTYDTETGVDTETTVTVEQRVSGPVATAEDEAAQQVGAMTAEKNNEDNDPPAAAVTTTEEDEQSDETPTQDTTPTDDSGDDDGDDTKVTGAKKEEDEGEMLTDTDSENEDKEDEEDEEDKKENASLDAFIAEMKDFVAAVKAQNEELKNEIAEIKEHMTGGKMIAEVDANINPFMDSIKLADTEYRLLKPEEPKSGSYRLLD